MPESECNLFLEDSNESQQYRTIVIPSLKVNSNGDEIMAS